MGTGYTIWEEMYANGAGIGTTCNRLRADRIRPVFQRWGITSASHAAAHTLPQRTTPPVRGVVSSLHITLIRLLDCGWCAVRDDMITTARPCAVVIDEMCDLSRQGGRGC